MKVAVRTDASRTIGGGHVMRCLTLANSLRKAGADVFFICQELEGDFTNFIEDEAFKVVRIKASCTGDANASAEAIKGEEVDWLVVDSYALDASWEVKMRPYVKKIMVIDDLADRKHDSDLLLDCNFYEDMKSRYDNLLPEGCVKLIGPGYALLRSEFAEARAGLKARDGKIERIMIFFGSSDLTNETTKALQAVGSLGKDDIAVDAVIGANNPHKGEIEAEAKKSGAVCHYWPTRMAALMASADLFIGAGGTTTWERSSLGLPSIIITVAENQVRSTEDLGAHKIHNYLGQSEGVSAKNIYDALKEIFSNIESAKEYSRNSLDLVDGLGAGRCAEILAETSEYNGSANG